MEYRFIPQQELRKWWSAVRPGMDKIKGKSPENWIVEDVYTDCFNQKAMLWVLIENNRYEGFFVLQPMGEELHVWAAYSVSNDEKIVKDALQFIKNMAREAGNKYLTFSSHRPGWDRRAKSYGFKPRKWISEV